MSDPEVPSEIENYASQDALSVGPRLRMFLPSLTPAERAVTEWLLQRENFRVSPSLREVAAALGVSEPLLVKVARRLGYPGFKALRSALMAYHNLPNPQMDQDLSKQDSVEEIQRKTFLATRQVLDEVESITPPHVIEQAATLLYRARQRDLYGVGGSATVCADAAHKFLRIGIRASVFSDRNLMVMSASLLGPDDAVLAVSHSGQTSDVLAGVRVARRCHAPIIALTNSFASSLAKEADLVLCAPARDSPLMGQNAAARIAQLTLLDTLFMCLARQNYDLAEANLRKTMSSVLAFHAKAKRRSRPRPSGQDDLIEGEEQ